MLHGDFLQLARRLVEDDPRRPKTIHLRRATSAAYYAVFHRLINDAVRALFGNGPAVATINPQNPQTLRVDHVASRWFNHNRMKAVSAWFETPSRAPKPVQKLLQVGKDSLVPTELRTVADHFVSLQELRHKADYDPSLRPTRTQAREAVDKADNVFQLCDALGGHPMYRLYQLLLLTGDGVVAER